MYTVKKLASDFAQIPTMKGKAGGRYGNIYRLRTEKRNGYNCLINYHTIIACWVNNQLVINDNHYSSTTTKHQNRLKNNSYNKILVNENQINKLVNNNISIEDVK